MRGQVKQGPVKLKESTLDRRIGIGIRLPGADRAVRRRLTWHKPPESSAGRAVVVKADTERFPSLAAQYNVRSVPNFAVFSRGQL